jgi:hypothetical protein
MDTQIELLRAELDAIIYWDSLYLEDPAPSVIDKDGFTARFFRRVQVLAELLALAKGNDRPLTRFPKTLCTTAASKGPVSSGSERTMKHAVVRWNPATREHFCTRCGRTSDAISIADAQERLEQYDCVVPSVDVKMPEPGY